MSLWTRTVFPSHTSNRTVLLCDTAGHVLLTPA
jgi:hypothetical protein